MNKCLDFNDVLIVPQPTLLSSRKEVSPYMANGRHSGYIPVLCSNMTTVGTMAMAREMHANKFLSCLHKFYSLDAVISFFEEDESRLRSTFVSIGMGDGDVSFVKTISDHFKCRDLNICMDVANGYQSVFLDRIKEVALMLPHAFIMAGNVATARGASPITSYANSVKVGIGSGTACLTRRVTGVGVPQLSAVMDVYENIGYKTKICSDGGHNNSGDICKAFGAGASYVMLGGMLAGHEECLDGDTSASESGAVPFYGMSSDLANNSFAGGLKDYRTSEGRELSLPNKGKVYKTLKQIEGGIRSCLTYNNCAFLDDFIGSAEFIRVNRQLNTKLENFE